MESTTGIIMMSGGAARTQTLAMASAKATTSKCTVQKLRLELEPEDLQAERLASLFLLSERSPERMLGTLARFGKISVCTFDQGVVVAVGKLAFHGVVSSLVPFVGFERAFSTVGIIAKMITGANGHGGTFLSAQGAQYL
jgi:hypothetical protein